MTTQGATPPATSAGASGLSVARAAATDAVAVAPVASASAAARLSARKTLYRSFFAAYSSVNAVSAAACRSARPPGAYM